MIRYLFLLLSLNTCFASEMLRVAVIDTGLDLKDSRFSYLLCDEGNTSKSFVTDASIKDDHGHGTHIAGLIKSFAGDSQFCFIIIKYYSEANPGLLNLKNEITSIRWAIEQKVDIINISAGGPEISKTEENLIKRNPKITFIVAAGNDKEKLDCVKKAYYPACYNYLNLISVGCLDCESSNFGLKIKAWEFGNNIYSTYPKNLQCNLDTKECGMAYMTGTSQATAIHTGKLIYKRTHQ